LLIYKVFDYNEVELQHSISHMIHVSERELPLFHVAAEAWISV